MTKPAQVSPDPLIMAVRKAIKAIEPRPTPTETRIGPYGYKQVQCPVCGEWCPAKRGSYNQHWTHQHGTLFWKEQAIIDIVKKSLTK